MGANNSHADSNLYNADDGKKHHLKSDYIVPPNKKGGKHQGRGKPSPPSQPKALETTHNAVTMSWQPPRHNAGGTIFAYTVEMTTPRDPKAWTVLTRSCQTSRYQAKGLQTAMEYIFRVRAENIHGVSKGSRPSDVIMTNMYESLTERAYAPVNAVWVASSMRSSATFPCTSAAESDVESSGENGNLRIRTATRRRHSINFHLEGAVTTILNHTDIEVKAATPGGHEVKVLTLKGKDRRVGGSTLNRSDESVGFERGSSERGTTSNTPSRYNTLQREAATRSSLPLGSRKRSLPILLPGTKINSLSKLRDSHTLPNIKAKGEMSNLSSLDSLKRRMGGMELSGEVVGDPQRPSVRRSRPGSDVCSNYSSGSSVSKEDVTDGKSCCSCACSCSKMEAPSLNEDGTKKPPHCQDETDSSSVVDKCASCQEGKGCDSSDIRCDRCGCRQNKRHNGTTSDGKCGGNSCCPHSCPASQRNSQATDDSEPLSEDSGNPWERHDDVSLGDACSPILSAPVCDDIKMALYARSLPDGPTSWALARSEPGTDDLSDSGHHVGHQMDLRALRTLLHSDDIIVKPTSRSLPDMAGVGGGGLKCTSGQRNSCTNTVNNNNNNNNNNNKLTTILDLDEDEDSVRITTL